MITVVIVINCLLASICLGLAWRLWRLGNDLRLLRWMMGDLTRSTEAALQGATEALISGQQGTQRLQWRYRHMHQQLRQLRQVLVLASWGQTLLFKTMGRQRRLAQEQTGSSDQGQRRKQRPRKAKA